jgi:predicted ATP-dependent endonuclease of OLD family
MKLSKITINNYKALKDVSITLSQFVCLIGENNSGKSSFLQALTLFFSGTKLNSSYFYNEDEPIRIEIVFEDINESDLIKLSDDHRFRITRIIKEGRLILVRKYEQDGRSSYLFREKIPSESRFSIDIINELIKGRKPGQAFVDLILSVFPELEGKINQSSNQVVIKSKIQELAESLPDELKQYSDLPLPTGIDKSITNMLPNVIYIPAVKDLMDDIKTTETTPFGKILTILLNSVESKLPNTDKIFQEINSKLNRIKNNDGSFVDERLDEVKIIESTVGKYVKESFSDVDLEIRIPPPELKTVFSSARILVNDGVDGLIETKGDGLRRAIIFSILRTYVEIRSQLEAKKEISEDKELNGLEKTQSIEPSQPSFLLLFEEPELYLHPKAQNILFDALKIFSKQNHVIVSTHSPMFFAPGVTETFVKLRKSNNNASSEKPFTKASQVDLTEMKSKDQFQIISFENNNAAFFADTVVLVEGDSDYLVFPHIAKTINPSWDTMKKPILFARIGGKGNIRRYREFFQQFEMRVPVISDLDLLVNGFDKINCSDSTKALRDRLLQLIDQNIESESKIPTAKTAHDSGDLKSLYKTFLEKQKEYLDGKCTLDQLNVSCTDFFNWQNKNRRLEVLKNSSSNEIVELKWQLLDALRSEDIFVLERGDLEAYYPDEIKVGDKPTMALRFCQVMTRPEEVLSCCGEQNISREETIITENEFKLIFEKIFE